MQTSPLALAFRRHSNIRRTTTPKSLKSPHLPPLIRLRKRPRPSLTPPLPTAMSQRGTITYYMSAENVKRRKLQGSWRPP